VNKAIAKDTPATAPTVEVAQTQEQVAQQQVAQQPVAPQVAPTPAPAPAASTPTPIVPTPQRTRKGLVNKAISKDGALSKPKDDGVDAKQEAVAEDSAAASTTATPAQEKNRLGMKAIAAWQPMNTHEADNTSMIKALGLEPVQPTRVKPRPASRAEAIQDLKNFAEQQKPKGVESERATASQDKSQDVKTPAAEEKKPEVVSSEKPAPSQDIAPKAAAEQPRTKGLRLKNATLLPGGGIKEISMREVEQPKPKVEESKPTQVAEARTETKTNSSKTVSALLLGKGGFSLRTMLQFRSVISKDAPKSSLGYCTASRDEEDASPEMWRRGGGTPSWRRDAKTGKPKDTKESLNGLWNKAANPYKKSAPSTREEVLAREVRSLLNKICPENKDKIIKKTRRNTSKQFRGARTPDRNSIPQSHR
jgi:hypothetical protein